MEPVGGVRLSYPGEQDGLRRSPRTKQSRPAASALTQAPAGQVAIKNMQKE